jgi:N-methylhydantoinase B
MSGMYDRINHPASGFLGGQAGAPGDFVLSSGEKPERKKQLRVTPDLRVSQYLPGGGGYFAPFERDPEQVLEDVVYGYVSIEGAERDYGVKIICSKGSDEQIALPEHFGIDWDATRRLRAAEGGTDPGP